MSCSPRTFSALLAFVFAVPSTSYGAGLAVHRLDSTSSTLAAELVKDQFNVIMVWTTYCPVCRAQYPVLSRFHDAHHNRDATVLGIALAEPEDRAAVASYRSATRQSFPSVTVRPEALVDAFERAVGEPFGGTPTYLLFDAAGTLRTYLVGPTTEAQLEELIASHDARRPE